MANTLSRLLATITLATISAPFVLDFGELEEQVVDDPYLDNILTTISTNPGAYPHFAKIGTTMCHKGRVIIPEASPLVPCLLHCSPYNQLAWGSSIGGGGGGGGGLVWGS